MDPKLRKLIEQRLRRKFGSHGVLYGKDTPKVPETAEREYRRLVNAYIGLVKKALEAELAKLRETYRETREAAKADAPMPEQSGESATDLMLAIAAAFTMAENSLTVQTNLFDLTNRMNRLANLTRKLTVREWKRAIRATLAIDIREDYYLGEFFQEQLDAWVEENVDLIKTIPHDCLSKMRDIVYDGYVNGRTTTQMTKDIQRVYSVDKRRARFIARDQVAKLNSQITQAQQRDAGVEEYVWSTVEDERVRYCHRELNGQTFRWDEPPEMWTPIMKNKMVVGRAYTGRHCHPGEDFQCRCVAIPVFKREGMNLPVDEDALTMTITVK